MQFITDPSGQRLVVFAAAAAAFIAGVLGLGASLTLLAVALFVHQLCLQYIRLPGGASRRET